MPELMSLTSAPPSREEVNARNKQRHDLLQRMDSEQAEINASAIDECQKLAASEICVLIRMAEEPKYPPPSPRTKRWRRGLFLLSLAFVISASVYFHITIIGSLILWGGLSLYFMMLSAYRRDEKRYSASLRNQLAVVVANTQDTTILPEAMRFLCHSHSLHSWPTPYNVMTPLEQAFFNNAAHILQSLDAEQIRAYGLQQKGLCLFLGADICRKMPQTSVRVLNYLEQFGTSSAISQVAIIADDNLSRHQPKGVQEAAQRCLAALQQRAYVNNQPQTLLRASSAPTAPPDVLLRPAAAQASQPQPDTLLRPAIPTTGRPPISGKIINASTQTSSSETHTGI